MSSEAWKMFCQPLRAKPPPDRFSPFEQMCGKVRNLLAAMENFWSRLRSALIVQNRSIAELPLAVRENIGRRSEGTPSTLCRQPKGGKWLFALVLAVPGETNDFVMHWPAIGFRTYQLYRTDAVAYGLPLHVTTTEDDGALAWTEFMPAPHGFLRVQRLSP